MFCRRNMGLMAVLIRSALAMTLMTAVCHGFSSKGQYNKWARILECTVLPPTCPCVGVYDGNVTAQRVSVIGWAWPPHCTLSPHHRYSRIILRPALSDLTGAFDHQIPRFSKKTPLACAGWGSAVRLTDETLIVVVVMCSWGSFRRHRIVLKGLLAKFFGWLHTPADTQQWKHRLLYYGTSAFCW